MRPCPCTQRLSASTAFSSHTLQLSRECFEQRQLFCKPPSMRCLSRSFVNCKTLHTDTLLLTNIFKIQAKHGPHFLSFRWKKWKQSLAAFYAEGGFFFFISAEYSLCYRIYDHLGFGDETKVQKEHPTCSRVATGQPQADG